jgi:3-deoxy-D-manno-octulosonate 8-phosphate phosphatase (KDO 8-P phosphatase)
MEVEARARKVRALVLDVDGVLTDGALYYGRGGESLKRFAARDGLAIVTAQENGLPVAVLSGRLAPPLRSRLHDLRVPERLVIEGSRDKSGDIAEIAARLGLTPDDLAFMGDDLPDLPALARVRLAACPANAVPEVRERCQLVCAARGGEGAVREVIELLFKAQGRWHAFVAAWDDSAPGNDGPATGRGL